MPYLQIFVMESPSVAASAVLQKAEKRCSAFSFSTLCASMHFSLRSTGSGCFVAHALDRFATVIVLKIGNEQRAELRAFCFALARIGTRV